MMMFVSSIDHRASAEFPLGKESGKPSGASKRGRENLNVKVDQTMWSNSLLASYPSSWWAGSLGTRLTHYTLSLMLCVYISTQLFKLHEEMKSVKKKMETLQKSLLRHKGRLVSVHARNVVYC